MTDQIMNREVGPARQIGRAYRYDDAYTVATTEGGTDRIDVRQFAGGSVKIPTGSSITLLTLYGAMSEGDTYQPIYDANNAAVTLVVAADRVVCLPDDVFSVAGVKLLGNAAGTIEVFLKG